MSRFLSHNTEKRRLDEAALLDWWISTDKLRVVNAIGMVPPAFSSGDVEVAMTRAFDATTLFRLPTQAELQTTIFEDAVKRLVSMWTVHAPQARSYVVDGPPLPEVYTRKHQL